VAGDEAQSILDQFDRQVPFVKQLAEMCETKAKRTGFIQTILGRRCRFPLHESGKGWDWCHKAINRLIQGSAADQTKRAMVDLDAAGFRMQLQVHDEIDQTVESPEQGEAIGEIMRNCLPIRVPSKVDVELGPSWGEAA
jgi:DNA polymerase I-like protein with 3'-5' exonuclease and polymerase domains